VCVQGAVCNVTGVWMSAMGSILKLAVSPDAELGGNYMTSVETMKGVAGNQRQSRLSGLLNRGAQPTFAFSVVWEGGSSSSWVGQCLVLGDGSQVLKTLWMLRSAAQGPEDDWKSTR
ncbi:AVR4 protein, partial [Amia calva]|nr:AVR4 protein [Amia calva]